MTRQAFERVLFLVGVTTALIGVYFASQTSTSVDWGNIDAEAIWAIVAMVVIAAGSFMAIVGLVLLVGSGEERESFHEGQLVLPGSVVPLIYVGFIVIIALVSGLVAGYYLGRNEGVITAITAFILANIIFGLPLALARAGSSR